MIEKQWILLAEDDANDADLATRTLAKNESHAEIVVARDGEEALACLHHKGAFHHHARGNPVLVVLDLKMPRVDGFEALTRIRSDARLKHIPVVIFSSSRDEGDVARCYELGANAYVVKPVEFRQYAAALQELASFWTVRNEPPPDGDGGNRRPATRFWVAHKV